MRPQQGMLGARLRAATYTFDRERRRPGGPTRYLVTLNAHGAYSDERFILPVNVYVLVPHPDGFDAPYALSSPSNGLTFEEILYRQSPDVIPQSSSGGWHVYKPGEVIRNVRFRPWSMSSDTSIEYDSWIRTVPPSEKSLVGKAADGKIPDFAFVRARDSKGQALSYMGIPKFKVKVFGSTDLRSVTNRLHQQTQVGPIILIPFTCNDSALARNPAIAIDVFKVAPFPAISDWR
jgi:hypothetical protein